jgi:outer membrane lipase/esterase
MQQGRRPLLALIVAAAALLAGCGGGDSAGPRVPISRVVVAGDSLADAGTFGARFTVQNAADPAAGFPVFPQIVAQQFGVTGQCPFFVATSGTTFAPEGRAGCTSFAVGGGRIAGVSGPFSIPTQLARALQEVGGLYREADLVLVDGGGNDAADLLRALLGGPAAYQNFLLRELDAATIAATLAQPNGSARAAVLYMRELAGTYYGAIKANALDRGATHVAVLDMPDVTLTPLAQAALRNVAQTPEANGGGPAAAANVRALLQGAIDAFNAQLRTNVGNDGRVAVVPFNADFTGYVTRPADFGLTNVTTPACAVVGITDFGTQNPGPCNSAALDANAPAGLAPGWWQSWVFSDGFHPTPFGHNLLAQTTRRALVQAGWL